MQSKFTSPLLGYNNNVRHKNRVFHIQTEDSGVKHPHIITHLFMDGGRIVKSVKKSYAEHVGVDGMADIVKGMMKEQHKGMLIALRDGQFDHIIDPEAAAAKTAAAAAGQQAPVQASPHTAPAAAAGSTGMRVAAVAPTPPAADSKTLVQRSPLSLDIDALERAAKDAEGSSAVFHPTSDLPPPPDNVLRSHPGSGGYRAQPGTEERPRSRPPSNRPAPGAGLVPGPRRTPSEPARRAPAVATPADNRYAPTRPAAIFGATRPANAATTSSIFGGDLMSDKSLDEVILSYLAEDLELESRKK